MLILLMSLAQAQEATDGQIPAGLNGQLFRPSLDAKNTLWTNDTLRAPNKYTFGRAIVHYTNDPVIYVDGAGERSELVSGIWQLDAMVAHTRGPVRFGLQLPVYLRSFGEAAGGESGLGDLALDLKFSALDRSVKPVGLAFAGRVFVPTATVQAPLGAEKLGWEVEAIVDKELSEKWLLAANVGTRGVPTVELENLTWDDQLFLRGGLGYTMRPDQLGFSADLASQFTYNDLSNPAGRPVEGLLGFWGRLTPNLMLRGGAGAGLNSGLGAPKYRVMLGLGFEPALDMSRDSDADGVEDKDDACTDTPEDMDGYMDADGCPEATPVTVTIVDADGAEIPGATWTQGSTNGANGEGLELDQGAHSFTATAEGFAPNTLEVDVPGGAGTELRIQLGVLPGTLMVTAVDEEGNPIPDAVWTSKELSPGGEKTGAGFTAKPGEYKLTVSAPGYRQKGANAVVVSEAQVDVQVVLVPAKVELTAERIDIKESVYFEVSKAVIKPESLGLLDEVAETLIAHPELTLIRIEGHTDSRGAAASNKDLSQRRAEAVRSYLVSKGVEAERLEAVGYGEEKPLDKAETQAAWAKNRRVDFFVAERSD